MQQDNLTILTPPQEAAMAFCAALRIAAAPPTAGENRSAPRLFKA